MKVSSIKKNYLFNLILTVSSLVFPLLSFKYVSEILLPAGTGKVGFAISVVTYFNMLAQLGIPTYGIRAAAKLREDRPGLCRLVQELQLIGLLTSAVSYGLLFLCIALIPKLQAEKTLYLAVCPMIFLNAVGMEWLYKGLEQYRYITVRSLIFKLAAFICMVFMIHEEDDYVLYGALTVFASSASNLCNLWNGKGYLFAALDGQKLNLRQHIRPVLIFFAMSCAITVYTNLDTVMLGFLTNDTEVGYYDAAVKLKSVLVLMVTALSSVVLPRATYFIEHDMRDDMSGLIRKSVKLALVLAVPMTLFLMLYAPEAIHLISGSAYDPAILPMRIILPALILIGLSNITGIQVLVPQGREKCVVYSVAAGAAADAVLNLVFIPKLGAAGAALGTLLAEALVLMMTCYYLKDEVREFFRGVPWLKILLASLMALAVSLIARLFGLSDILCICMAGLLYGIVYAGLLLITKTVTVQELKG